MSSTIQGPIIAIGASVDDLRAQREALRAELDAIKSAIKEAQTSIATDQRNSHQAQNADEQAGFQASIDNTRVYIGKQRESFQQLQNDIRQLSTKIPSLPLKVEVTGIGTDALEALTLIRDQFGELLGPLNGVTGRISSLIETFKLLGKIGEESTASAAAAAVKAANSIAAPIAIAGAQTELFVENLVKADAAEEKSVQQGELYGASLQKIATAEEASSVGTLAMGSAATTAETGVGGLIGGIAIGVTAVLAFAAGAFEAEKSTAELAHQYEILGQRAGITGQEVQGMTLVAKISGVSIDEFALTLERLSFRLSGSGGRGGGVAAGANQVQSAIEIMIGSVKNASGQFLSPIEIFKRLSDQFAVMPDGVAKTALAMELFGRSGAQLIPTLNLGSSAINELIQKANELGISIDGQPQKIRAWDQAVGELGLSWDSLKETLGDLHLLQAATKAVDLFTGALQSLKTSSNQISESLKGALNDTFTDKGISTLTAQGEAQVKAISDALAQKEQLVGRQGQTAFIPQLQNGLFPEADQQQIEESLKRIHAEVAGISDEGAKNVALQVRYRQLVQDLIDQGVIQQKDAVTLTAELQKRDEINSRTSLASPASVAASAAFTKQVQEINKELQTLDEKTNIFGDHAAGAFKKSEVSIADLKQKVIEFQTLVNSVGTAPQQGTAAQNKTYLEALNAATAAIPAGKQAIQEYTQAVAAQAQEAIKLQTEMEKLGEKYIQNSQKLVDLEQKQLSAAAQMQILRQAVRVTTDELNLSLVAIDRIAAVTPGGATAIKALHDAQAQAATSSAAVAAENARYAQSVTDLQAKITGLDVSLASGKLNAQQTIATTLQVKAAEDQLRAAKQAHIQVNDTLVQSEIKATQAVILEEEAVLAYIPKGVENNAARAKLNETINAQREALQKLNEEQAKAVTQAKTDADAQDKLAVETAAVQGRLAKYNEELAKAVAEYQAHATGSDKVTDKIKTLQNQLTLATAEWNKSTAAVKAAQDELERIATSGGGQAEQKQALTDLEGAEQKHIADLKEITRLQKELADQTPTLTSAFEQLTQIVGQFSGGLPAPLVRIVAMIKAFQSLIDLIQKLNSTKVNPINLPGTAGGSAGTGGSVAGGGGSNGSIFSGILGSEGAQTGLAVGGSAGIGAGIGGQIGGTEGAIGGGIAGVGALSTAESLSSAGGALTGSTGLAGVGVLGPIGIAVGALLLVFGAISQKIKAKTAELAAQISQSFQTIVDQYQAGNTSLVTAIQQTEAARANAIATLSGKKGGQDQLNTIIPQFDQQIAQLQAAQKQILDTFNKLAIQLSFPSTVQSTIKSLQDLNDQVKQFIDAGGNAATAAQVFGASLNQIKGTTADSLLQSEQTIISAMLQENDLIKQRADLIKSTNDQINGILNQGVLSRSQTTAQTAAAQIQTIKDNANAQLTSIDDQKSALDAQIAGQQQLFGLSTNVNTLKATQLAIEKQISAEQAVQVASEQKLLQQLQALKPGATSVDLGALATGQGSAGNAQLTHDNLVTSLQQQLSELQVELKDATNASGATNQDRQDLRKQIADLQAKLKAAIAAPVVQSPDTGVAASTDTTLANAIALALGGAGGLSSALTSALTALSRLTTKSSYGNVYVTVNGSNLTPDQLSKAIQDSLNQSYKSLQGSLQV